MNEKSKREALAHVALSLLLAEGPPDGKNRYYKKGSGRMFLDMTKLREDAEKRLKEKKV